MYQTPVRHEDMSITKTSLRSQIVVPANELDLSTRRGEIEEVKQQLNLVELLSSQNGDVDVESEASDLSMNGDKLKENYRFSSMIGSTMSLEMDSASGASDSSSSIIISQKHSTPRPLKFPTRAVSSTPNQDLINNSKLVRHVSAQTNFTLNGRSTCEINNELMSFSVEEQSDGEDKYIFSCSTNPSFSMSIDSTSPLRDLTSKLINTDKTPVYNKGRKLSLRSKTMICSAMGKTKDRPRIWSRHKSLEEKRLFSNTFSLMPHTKTPPSQVEKVFHNPFEVDLQQRLGKTVFSPDVFENVISPSEDSEYIRWTIEDISSINPVPIDEDFTFTSDEEDPEKELLVQEQINRYFSETHSVLSPFDLPKPTSLKKIGGCKFYAAVASTPQKNISNDVKEVKNVGTQTALTFPESLSENLEESLKSYFKLYETDDFNISASNLRRKLFFHSEDVPPSPVRFERFTSPASENLSKSDVPDRKNGRYFSPLANEADVSSPEMSPVIADSTELMSRSNSLVACKKNLHIHFTDSQRASEESIWVGDNMTIDCSENGGASSAIPCSQDTGYHTEESWKQSTLASFKTLQHYASAPTLSPSQNQL